MGGQARGADFQGPGSGALHSAGRRQRKVAETKNLCSTAYRYLLRASVGFSEKLQDVNLHCNIHST